jgi:glycogen operon protein
MDNRVTPTESGTAAVMGASYDGKGVNFAIYSKHAEKIELCLFDDKGEKEIERITLPARTGDVWHGYVPGLKPGQVYGYRVHGPYDPENGHRFNPQKLLLDPYAAEVVGQINWTEEQTNPHKDSAPATVKARVAEPLPASTVAAPNIARNDMRIAEMHVRGATMLDEKVPEEVRGTYAGLASDAFIDYVKNELKANTIELMPAHAKLNDLFLVQKGLKNYWGYNTVGYFAPEPEYAADKDNARAEFKAMVDKLHANGIEIILDVVFNHAGEGDERGPTLLFRGIDNASYYRLDPRDKRKYVNDTGCGNTLDADNPAVRKMILDSLRHWVIEYGIDGFRFDLAPVLGRNASGYSKDAPFFKEIEADPVLSKIKLIAEPWDPGPGGYQLGNFPKGWAEWNDRFRDDVRKFWRGDYDTIGWLATRLAGSAPEFDRGGRVPQDSVNFITCHDGFTLHDVVSYSHKHNLANGEDNRDGTGENYSANYGAEGLTTDHAVIALREQQKRNMLATLFMAQGTPMQLLGDERGNSQGGNNNAYCQDNNTGWVEWDETTAEGKKTAAFVKKLAEFRDEHSYLCADHFLHGREKCADGIPDLQWIATNGQPRTDADWQKRDDKCLGMLLNEGAITGKPKGRRLMAVFNSAASSTEFKLPELKGGSGWVKALDTTQPGDDGKTAIADGAKVTIPARSVVVFVQEP